MNEDNFEYSLVVSFFKVGSDNKVLKDQRFKLASIDGKVSNLELGITSDGRYNINENDFGNWTGHEEAVYNLLPKDIKEIYDNARTIDDIDQLRYYSNFSVDDSDITHNYYIDFTFPLLIKQVSGENGYKTKDIIVKAHAHSTFSYDQDNNVTLDHLDIYVWNTEYGYVFDDVSTLGNITIANMANIDYSTFVSGDLVCMNTNAGMIIADESQCTEYDLWGSGNYNLVPYFVDEKGEVKFEITNTVNNLAKYNASKDRNLEYKIVVKNTGNAPSGDNVITTNVPKGIVLGASGISDNGIYDKNENTITWNVEKIEAGEKLTFTYTATAPEDTDGRELIGNSSITSSYVAGATHSTNTIVTLDKVVEIITNPETGKGMMYIANTNIGMPVSMVVIFSIILCMMMVLLLLRMKDEK